MFFYQRTPLFIPNSHAQCFNELSTQKTHLLRINLNLYVETLSRKRVNCKNKKSQSSYNENAASINNCGNMFHIKC